MNTVYWMSLCLRIAVIMLPGRGASKQTMKPAVLGIWLCATSFHLMLMHSLCKKVVIPWLALRMEEVELLCKPVRLRTEIERQRKWVEGLRLPVHVRRSDCQIKVKVFLIQDNMRPS